MSSKVKSSQVGSNRVESSRVESSRVESSQVKSSQVKSSQVKSSQVKSSQVKHSDLFPSSQVMTLTIDIKNDIKIYYLGSKVVKCFRIVIYKSNMPDRSSPGPML